MSEPTDILAGRFVVIDGPDGVGKSTQVRLLAEWLTGQGLPVRTVRDPGGTVIGDRIRQILLDRQAEEMAVACELMLYMASRAQLVAEQISPALSAGQCVLSDRYISSTIAYQGAGGVPADVVRQAGRLAVGDVWPDLTIVLDLPVDVGLSRAGQPDEHDRMESKGLAFHQRVREIFLEQYEQDPGHFALVDGRGTIEAVHKRICQALTDWEFHA